MTGQKVPLLKWMLFRDYEATTYEAYRSGDGTAVLAGDPFVFDKSNMAEWIKQL